MNANKKYLWTLRRWPLTLSLLAFALSSAAGEGPSNNSDPRQGGGLSGASRACHRAGAARPEGQESRAGELRQLPGQRRERVQ